MLAIGIYLFCSYQWTWLSIWLGILMWFGGKKFQKNPKVIHFFQPVFQKGFNGIKIHRLIHLYANASGPFLYCFHPHGIVANGFGVALHAVCENRPNVTVAVAKPLVWFNFAFRWFVNSYGCPLTSVACDDMRAVMARRTDLAICPGGFEEVMLMENDRDVVYLNHRTGFIKLAAQYGYTLVPIFAFGESDFYSNAIWLPRKISKLLAHYGFPLVIPRGISKWNFMPNKPANGLVVVFGDPISASGPNAHEEYISEIKRIHKTYRMPNYHRELLVL